ncbi:hypothetical protein CR162_17620 [Pseudoroseomonas rhizosphaerae]|uniref:histidine kinase n=1 Tax=Teichococcus rhizosphaerae TaxID=1335062 RepID=A0A2C7A5I0_9PROT|nr:HWE histidine kinase domain-containing protein [Pseudoroseomonas rhizosphaerae]PHK93600.1 hypothetical protein CR162_17620 [Pseudoroseomonas rhizosphaerae]
MRQGKGRRGAQGASTAPPPPGGRQIGLRSLLALFFGLIGLFAAGTASLVASQGVYSQLRDDAGAELAAAAERVADLLDRGLFERMRDIAIAASSDTLRQPGIGLQDRRAVLRRVQETYPDYAILLQIGPDGRVLATDSGLLEGIDVSQRTYFQEGRWGPFLGEVHDALLMAPLMGSPPGEPPRVLDLAAPILGREGQFLGVLAAHLSAEWVEGIERSVMRPLTRRHPGSQALLLDRDGRMVAGPRAQLGQHPAVLREEALRGEIRQALRGGPGSRLVSLPDGERLVGFAPLNGHRDVPGLGWSVLVVLDAGTAFAPAEALRWRLLGIGLAAALLAALLGRAVAGRIARPLERLSRAAPGLHEQAEAVLPPAGPLPELAALRRALATLHRSLRERERDLRESEARLRAVLEQMPVGVFLAERPSGRLVFQNARAAEIMGRPMRPATGVADYVHHGGQYPDGTPLRAEDHPLARAVRDDTRVQHATMPFRRADGAVIWLAISAGPVRVGDGAAALAVCAFDDVTEMRAAAERQRLLAQEVDHRARNALAVVQATLRLSRAETLPSFVQALEGRVAALSRAQSRLAASAWKGMELGELLREEIGAAARGIPGVAERLDLLGPRLVLAAEAAQPVSLMIHELTGNALQHGALSRPGGRITVEWRIDAAQGLLRLRWQELRGLPPPADEGAGMATPRRGFGLRMIEATLGNQLGGRHQFEWGGEGLVLSAWLPLARILSREAVPA